MNKARKRAYMVRWHAENLEKYRVYAATYYATHPERVHARRVKYSATHREEDRAYGRKYVATHRAEKNAHTLNRYHRKRANGGSVRREAWEALKASYRYRCAYCHQRKLLTQDHVVPIVKGGWHVIENIVPACRSCNSSKGAKV